MIDFAGIALLSRQTRIFAFTPRSSSGSGLRTFSPATEVRILYGVLLKHFFAGGLSETQIVRSGGATCRFVI